TRMHAAERPLVGPVQSKRPFVDRPVDATYPESILVLAVGAGPNPTPVVLLQAHLAGEQRARQAVAHVRDPRLAVPVQHSVRTGHVGDHQPDRTLYSLVPAPADPAVAGRGVAVEVTLVGGPGLDGQRNSAYEVSSVCGVCTVMSDPLPN